MSRTARRKKIVLPTAAEDRAIIAAAKADPDAQPLTAKQLKAMVPMRTLRGRPKSPKRKLLVSIRYSPEVVAYFKSTGEGWQARMDSVLRQYIARRTKAA
ncbi:MAG: BrnA antitoxin family protein [Candidatus Eisenbacteria bacterium]|nr:BrnA antitoxin family protein [Candidatus Eisenbacteria bacterium]